MAMYLMFINKYILLINDFGLSLFLNLKSLG
jgi:hypothetical protein